MQASSDLSSPQTKQDEPNAPAPAHRSILQRFVRLFRPSHQHTAFSATLLLISAVMLSRVIGYARDAYIAWAYGADGATDAYVAAFTLPDRGPVGLDVDVAPAATGSVEPPLNRLQDRGIADGPLVEHDPQEQPPNPAQRVGPTVGS